MAKEIEFSRIDPEAAEKKSLGEGDDDEAKVKERVWNIFYLSPFYNKDCSNE